MKKNTLMVIATLLMGLSTSQIAVSNYDNMDPQDRMARINRKKEEAQAKRQKDKEKADIKYQEKKANIRYKEKVDTAKIREDKEKAAADMRDRRYIGYNGYNDIEQINNAQRTADTSLFR